jgi:hypothetical protein
MNAMQLIIQQIAGGIDIAIHHWLVREGTKWATYRYPNHRLIGGAKHHTIVLIRSESFRKSSTTIESDSDAIKRRIRA